MSEDFCVNSQQMLSKESVVLAFNLSGIIKECSGTFAFMYSVAYSTGISLFFREIVFFLSFKILVKCIYIS